MKTVILLLVLALLQGTSTQIYHVRGDRDHYTGVVGEKQVEIVTKDCLHKADDEQANSARWHRMSAKELVTVSANIFRDTCASTRPLSGFRDASRPRSRTENSQANSARLFGTAGPGRLNDSPRSTG
jgi:hypothetical protein